MPTKSDSGLLPVEDVTAAIREGRDLRPAKRYRILVADEQLNNREVDVADPVPTGRQILDAAAARPVDEFSLFAILPTGEFEDIRLDETYDLRGRGAERFILFRTDREFKFTLDSGERKWGKPHISGFQLKKLAEVPVATYNVYLEVRGGQDRLIRDDELVDLAAPGIERFITLIRDTTEGLELLTLPEADHRYLDDHGIAFELVSAGSHTGVVFKAFNLPVGKFNHPSTDILVLLPPGYPDVPPDMFFCDPWLSLRSTGGYPTKADVSHGFNGRNWQRWSRHNTSWRAGVDGLHTMLKRIEHALQEAK